MTSASRLSLPCSTCCITAVQVNSLEIEPGRNRVVCGIDRRPLCDVGVAVAALRQDLAVLDHHHDRAGDVAPAEGVGHVAVEPGIDVVGGQLACCPAWPDRRGCRPGRGSAERPRLRDQRRRGEVGPMRTGRVPAPPNRQRRNAAAFSASSLPLSPGRFASRARSGLIDATYVPDQDIMILIGKLSNLLRGDDVVSEPARLSADPARLRARNGWTLKEMSERSGIPRLDPVEGRARPADADLRQAAAAQPAAAHPDVGAVRRARGAGETR